MPRHLLLLLAGSLLAGCAQTPRVHTFALQVARETAPVPSSGDAADDPAIWVNATDPTASRIVATDKKGGLLVYDLRGRLVQSLPGGRPNNVDLRAGFPFADGPGTLVVAEDRADDTLALWRLREETGRLEPVPGPRPKCGFHVYGSTLYHSAKTGEFFAFVAENDLGQVRQFHLTPNAVGGIDARQVRVLPIESEAEGMVADDELGLYYIAEEKVGVWRFAAEPDGGTAARLVLPIAADAVELEKRGGLELKPDLEGLALYKTSPTKGYLLVSAQGINSYLLLDREGWNPFRGSFTTADGPFGDATQETDGLDATSAPLGTRFPKGIIVVQDGDNPDANQNFKILSAEGMLKGMGRQ